MAKKSGLGKGLTALFDESTINLDAHDNTGNVITVRISDIEPDKTQPRKTFEPEALSSLADSISTHGILQPIVVRRPEQAGNEVNDSETPVSSILKGKYKIVAGERRWRAAKMAGLSEVPVIVRNFTDKETAAIMLVENLQREDLNPVEQARGLARLIDEFSITQEEAAAAVGISRPAITNALRLLTLPEFTLKALEDGQISAGHARALIPLAKAEAINKLAESIIARNLSVRETEKLVRNALAGGQQKPAPKVDENKRAYLEKLENAITSKLGRRVKISQSAKSKGGVLEVCYDNNDDLEAFLKSICGESIFEE